MKKILTVMLLLSLGLASSTTALAGETITRYRDCVVNLKSPSAAQGVVYVDIQEADKGSKNPVSCSPVGQTATVKATFSGSSNYYAALFAYPKPGYALAGFVLEEDYKAGRTSNFLKPFSPSEKTYRSGDNYPFAKVDSVTMRDPKVNPQSQAGYRFSPKTTQTIYAVFRKEKAATVTLTAAGTLEYKVNNSPFGKNVDNLTVVGPMDEVDFKFLSRLCTDFSLQRIDLSRARFSEVPDYAFAACYGLYEIKLPATGVRRFGTNAFYNCRSLKKFVKPSSVTVVEQNALTGLLSWDRVH